MTALIKASSTRNYELIEALIAAKADVNAKNNDGTTALIEALSAGHSCSEDIAKLLIDAGADVNIKNHDDTTALLVAAKHGMLSTVDLLIRAGANKNVKDKKGKTLKDYIPSY